MQINIKELFIWIILLSFIGYAMNIGSHNTIQGYTGIADVKDGGLTLLYFVFWIGVAIWAGRNNNKSVLTAFIIYSLFPLFYFIKFWATIMLFIIWMGPFRGLSNMTYVFFMIPIMPILFLAGYIISSKYHKKMSTTYTQ